MHQQVIPQQATQEHQDIFARFLFKDRNLVVGFRPFDDARVTPEGQLSKGKLVGDDEFIDGSNGSANSWRLGVALGAANKLKHEADVKFVINLTLIFSAL